MSFDLSRIRFDARRDFLGVVMQQGRVQLDSDWNEWVEQLLRRIQAGSLDTFNGNVVPRITPDGFLIELDGSGLTIGAGRIYVDGLLAENHGDIPGSWNSQLAELVGSLPINYTEQPYYPEPPDLPDGGPHLIYVDVWQRDITSLQQPDLIEQAVGVDTTGRQQTVWQVKFLADVGDISCATTDEDIPNWLAETAPSAGRLSTATGVPNFDPDPCQVPPAAGYRGLENQLYRLEVHQGGAVGDATFKWSRDNGIVASRVTHINPTGDSITVQSIGPDDVLSFHDGEWVEVTDDWRELKNLPGELRRIRVADGVDHNTRTLNLESSLTAGLFPVDGQQATDPARNTRVRRWDQSGQVRDESGNAVAGQNLDEASSDGDILIPAVGTRLFLEHGILVEFDLESDPAGGEFKSGDYWLFAARSVDGTVEILDRTPPLGIHHHYARLALVNFTDPGTQTDCRTLWPPVNDGESCDCSVCVSAEGHNDGSATIQQAIDQIKDSGGTLCLGVGTFNIDQPLRVDGGQSLRIRGQGWQTLLVGSTPGSILTINASRGVALENFTAIGSAGRSGLTSIVSANNVVDLRAEHINVLGVAVSDATSVGIGLSGNVLGVAIHDCAIVAERCLATVAAGDSNYVVTGELRVTQNLLFCSQRGISFDAVSLHFGVTRLADNLILAGSQAAINTTGAVLPGSSMQIADNVIYSGGDGIQAGVDNLSIQDNQISGFESRAGGGDGIVLEQGLDPVALDYVHVSGNRLRNLAGSGISVKQRLEQAIIADNFIDGMGLAAFVMSEAGAAGNLRFSGNQCHNLGLALTERQVSFAGLQFIAVQQGDILDNSIAHVARQAITSPGIDALRVAGIGQLRIAGNRFYGIGPDRISSAPVTAARLLPPFDRIAFENNSVERIAASDQQLSRIEWRALLIARESVRPVASFAPASYLAADDINYLLTASRVLALPTLSSELSVCENHLRGQFTDATLTLCEVSGHCLFADNHCEVVGEGGKEPLLGDLAGATLNASNNRLLGFGDFQNLHLRSNIKRVIVMGNTSTGPIVVLNGEPVPADINHSNIIGA